MIIFECFKLLLLELSKTINPTSDALHISLNFEDWVNTFVAKDKRFQDFCVNALKTNVASSQYAQDMWLFNNIFKTYVLQNKKGFYVDSGANDWKHLSNTFFYDVCLGWDGLCIEPSKEYHDNLKQYRSCKLIPECISNTQHKRGFVDKGVDSYITDGNELSCDTLSSMLENRTKIDFFSLDVEKHELEVLKSIDFKTIEIAVLLVEDFWLPIGQLDTLLLNGQSGFLKLSQFPIDSVFIHINEISKLNKKNERFWYPNDWDLFVQVNKDYRLQMIKENKISC